MKSHVVQTWARLAVLLAAAGNASCVSNCQGITGLPGVVPVADQVENAGALRLTSSGLAFLQANAGALWREQRAANVVTFSIPPSSTSTAGLEQSICADGSNPNSNPPTCMGELNLVNANLQFQPTGPHNLRVTGTLPFRIQALTEHVKGLCVGAFCAIDSDVTFATNGNGACPGGTFDPLPVDASFAFTVSTASEDLARRGFTTVTVERLTDSNAVAANLQNNTLTCGGFLGSVLNQARATTVAHVQASLDIILAHEAEVLVCMTPDPTTPLGCPEGSLSDGEFCRVPQGACVSRRLGLAGRMQSAALAPLVGNFHVPNASLDVVLAAGGLSVDVDRMPPAPQGDLLPVAMGATFPLVGVAKPVAPGRCVPLASLVMPTGTPLPAELLANTVTGWPVGFAGPHFGLAVSERHLNHTLAAASNAGQLCLELSTRDVPSLDAAALMAAVPSLAELGGPLEVDAVMLQFLPSAPPSVTLGNGTSLEQDATFSVQTPSLAVDVHVAFQGRFTRLFTLRQDVVTRTLLQVGMEGFQLVSHVQGSNAQVVNASPLVDIPASAAGALASIINSALEAGLNKASPINVDGLAPAGLRLRFPETVEGQGSPALQRLQQGTDAFLGIFGAFEVAGPSASIWPGTGHSRKPHGLPALPPTSYAVLALVGLAAASRRKGAMRRAGVLSLLAALVGYGCNCNPTPGGGGGDDASSALVDGAVASADAALPDAAGMPDGGTPVGDASTMTGDAGPSSDDAATAVGDAGQTTQDAGAVDVDAAMPVDAGPPPALVPGLVGSHLSAVVAGTTLWVSGHAERDPASGNIWGDLVVGAWNGTRVDWQAVDGVPDGPAVDPSQVDIHGFRGGQTAPGDDVGQFSSLAVDGAGHPAVAYQDRTHGRLKLARFDGATWTTSVVEEVAGQDLGRFARLHIQGQQWMLVYQAVHQVAGVTYARVRAATATETPGSPLQWSFENVAEDPSSPCDPAMCPAGTACTLGARECVPLHPAADCGAPCAAGQLCGELAGAAMCVAARQTPWAEVPELLGSGLSLALKANGDAAVALVDGRVGTLQLALRSSGGWSLVQLGVAGSAPSLAAGGAGAWHVAWKDTVRRQVRVVTVQDGAVVGEPQVVDSGDGVDGTPLIPPRWVGADAFLHVDGTGVMQLAYQDTTTGTLRVATGTPGAMGMAWVRKEVPQVGWGGAFNQVVMLGGVPKVVHWVRSGHGAATVGNVAVDGF